MSLLAHLRSLVIVLRYGKLGLIYRIVCVGMPIKTLFCQDQKSLYCFSENFAEMFCFCTVCASM